MSEAIPTPHCTTFFCARKNASHFSLSGAKKRQLPRTLDEIGLSVIKMVDKKMLKLYNSLKNIYFGG